MLVAHLMGIEFLRLWEKDRITQSIRSYILPEFRLCMRIPKMEFLIHL